MSKTQKIILSLGVSLIIIVFGVVALLIFSTKNAENVARSHALSLQTIVRDFRSQKGYYPYYSTEIYNFDQSARKYNGKSWYHVDYWPRDCTTDTQQCKSYEITLTSSPFGVGGSTLLRLAP